MSITKLFDLSERVALVTGSSAGIGFALARGLGRAGAHVVLNGRQPDRVARAAQILRDERLSVSEMPFDVTDSAAVKAAVEQIESSIGPIDILISNAGMQRRGPLEDYPEETWHELMKANVDSVFYVGQAVARKMIPRGRGKIINICSVQSELGRPSIAPYTATKGAVKMLTKGMAIDWASMAFRSMASGRATSRRNLIAPWSTTRPFPTGSLLGLLPGAGASWRI